MSYSYFSVLIYVQFGENVSGPVAEFTVVQKLNRSRFLQDPKSAVVPACRLAGISGARPNDVQVGRGFLVTFFRKKVTKKPAPGFVVEKKASFMGNEEAILS
ncbi:MAG: hypothetical protein KF746_06160 [Chitinophagaceae bacterium]|nr:hypothetical protein [Chitinophagaceae bacterium]